MIRGMTVLWTGLAVVVGIGLFMLKYEVQTLEDRLAGLKTEIRGNQEAIHVLKAEWSYLNDPERLRELNERHLGLVPLQPTQVVTIADLPMAGEEVEEEGGEAEKRGAPAPRFMVEAPQKPQPAPARAAEAKVAAPKVTGTKVAAAPKPAKPAIEAKRVIEATPAAAAPAPARRPIPVQAVRPAAPPLPAGNVLVIKSPALLEAERADGGARR